MQTEMPILICDAGDSCGAWVPDWYEQAASAVGGVRFSERWYEVLLSCL